MRTLTVCAALLAACASTPRSRSGSAPPPAAPAAEQSRPAPSVERLAADTPRTTAEGATFTAPAGWSIAVRGAATILEAPEGGSRLALVDVRARDADSAVAAAWAEYDPHASWPLEVATTGPDVDGWTDVHRYAYRVPPGEKRDVAATARRAGDKWTVIVRDVAQSVGEKREAAIWLVYDSLLPRGYERETFAGRKARTLDAARVARIEEWVSLAMRELRVPGVAVGIVQDGKVVLAEGFGVRELGKKEKPDGDTLFMIASNTKALTTLMLAKLVDEKRLRWEAPVTSLLPGFELGDAETTRQVFVRHLVCACTGLPRQDFEWLFQFGALTPEGAVAMLAGMQPTSKFGETFQYSNIMAAAGGFAGGHCAYPQLELGQAYDEAMRSRVLEPLGMTSTTFDFAKALAGNHAMPHAPDLEGRPVRAGMELNRAVVPLRPSGGAWSSVNDMLRYVSLELAEGVLPDGRRHVSREPLLERRKPSVALGKDAVYGMGLVVDTKFGTPVVNHGGDQIGFHSDVIFLPEHRVGAVVLTNGAPGWILTGLFGRKLLEVLFDGKPEADAAVASHARTFFTKLAAARKLLTVPADAAEAGKLARRYANGALGEIAVSREGPAVTFDLGEWKMEVASRRNADGTVSFVPLAPGVDGIEFLVGGGEMRTLTVRDAQHEYVFTEH